jgi:outer membrane protein
LELSDAPLSEPSALAEQALADRPELRALRSRIEAAEAALALARREYFPDFGLGTRYDSFWDDSRQRFMVELSVDLPIRLARRAAAVGEATSRHERLRREHDRLSDEVRVEVERAHRRLVESRRATELYLQVLLPAARDRVAAARSSFETGRAPFLVPIEAAKDQREVDLEFHEERAELYRRQAELERALGRILGQPSEGGIQ